MAGSHLKMHDRLHGVQANSIPQHLINVWTAYCVSKEDEVLENFNTSPLPEWVWGYMQICMYTSAPNVADWGFDKQSGWAVRNHSKQPELDVKSIEIWHGGHIPESGKELWARPKLFMLNCLHPTLHFGPKFGKLDTTIQNVCAYDSFWLMHIVQACVRKYFD